MFKTEESMLCCTKQIFKLLDADPPLCLRNEALNAFSQATIYTYV